MKSSYNAALEFEAAEVTDGRLDITSLTLYFAAAILLFAFSDSFPPDLYLFCLSAI